MSETRFPRRFGKYILLDSIAAGGMAEVYRGKVTGAEEFERLIAVKCMLPGIVADDHHISMFVDEAKISAQLIHANIVQVYELGKVDEQLYIAMELINGRDLRHVLRKINKSGQPMPVGFAAYVVAKAAEGLDAAHKKITTKGDPMNLIHRDVSPQNILVSYDGEVKVVDFGIAKAEERSTNTNAGVLKGKFAYMSPEQVMGETLDARTDIFALGAVLYEVLTGKVLFTGESDLSLLESVSQATVPDFNIEIPGLTEELDFVLRKALARDRRNRFATAGEMAEALEPLLIKDRSIFGSKKAKKVMREFYSDEIDALQLKQREYMAIKSSDCVDTEGRPEVSQLTRVLHLTDDFTANLKAKQQEADNNNAFGGDTTPAGMLFNDPFLDNDNNSSNSDDATQIRLSDSPSNGASQPEQILPVFSEGEQFPEEDSDSTAYMSAEDLRAAVGDYIAAPKEPSEPRLQQAPPSYQQASIGKYIVGAVLLSLTIIVSAFFLLRGKPNSNQMMPITEMTEVQSVNRSPTPVSTATAVVITPKNTATDRVKASSKQDATTTNTGYIQVVLSDGAKGEIFIDGKYIGEAPLGATAVSYGEHHILIMEAGGMGRTKNKTVTVSSKDTLTQAQLIQLAL